SAAGPSASSASPSVSITAMSTASSEVPVMNPRTRMARLHGPSPRKASIQRRTAQKPAPEVEIVARGVRNDPEAVPVSRLDADGEALVRIAPPGAEQPVPQRRHAEVAGRNERDVEDVVQAVVVRRLQHPAADPAPVGVDA